MLPDTGRLALIAGAGEIPIRIAQACAARGVPLFVVILDGHGEADLAVYPHLRASLGQVGLILSRLKREGCTAVTLIGRVPRPDFRALKLDARGAMLLPKVLVAARSGDDALLRTLVRVFESEGLRVVGAEEVMHDLAAPAGLQGAHAPRPQDWRDIGVAVRVVRAIGALDIGQAAAVADGLVLAVEAAEGTDAMLARVAELDTALRGTAQARRGVLVKLPKSGQELRVDLPVIGVRTVEGAARAGLAGIAIAAGASLIADAPAVRAAADAAGLFVVGIDADDLPPEAGGRAS
ncbi:MAG: UDP-2,3-diacylglucosamine diphosphatase LpxI [Alphaproteobacteria bacterium]|nr:UDP-2,3-diacylglucosamine diphosphatase LpxI [Alphaproteobacteria bacterium]